MLRAAFKGLLARKLRLFMTALSVALGVAFVAGTLIFSDTLNSNFDRLFASANQGVDVQVSARTTFSGQFAGGAKPVPASLLRKTKEIPGVKDAFGAIDGAATMVDKKGKPIQPQGPPTLGLAWTDIPQLNSLELRAGKGPSGPEDVVIDANTASKYGFRVGDRIKILFLETGKNKQFQISGIVGFGEADNLGGATLTAFTPRVAQRYLDKRPGYDSVQVVADAGVTPTELRDRMIAALPGRYQVQTGQSAAQEASDQVKGALGFFSTILLVFAAISLFVGSFLIFNTFSITVAQRARELALMRAIGATSRQVVRLVVIESLVIGVLASIIGLGLGVLAAIGIKALLASFGLDLPASGIVFAPRTAIVAMTVGVVITTLAALLPARRAGRVAPIAALRESMSSTTELSRRRTIAGALVTVAGAVGLGLGLFGNIGNGLQWLGAGTLAVFIGVAMLAPIVVRPLTQAFGAPLGRLKGVTGKLARGNAARNPGRTASTAAALMIGLALVCFAAVLASSLKATVNATLNEVFKADFVLQDGGGQIPFSPQVAAKLRKSPEIAVASPIRFGQWQDKRGGTQFLAAADPRSIGRATNLDIAEGSLAGLQKGGIFVSKDVADKENLEVGDTLPMKFASVGTRDVPVEGIYKEVRVLGNYTLSLADYKRYFTEQLDYQVFVKAAPGVSESAARAAVKKVLKDDPNIDVENQAQYKQSQTDQVNQLLGLIYALLALTIIVALFGIANTLGLSILERTREIGLMRAVGALRAQVRSMIRWEAAIVAFIGAVLGMVLGTLFGWAVVTDLRSQGITSFVVPFGQVLVFTVVAAVAGVVAAIIPARRAARLDVLRAVATE